MRFVLRLLGTWLLGVALILIIIDGTKTLAGNGIVLTSLADAWAMLHADSLEATGGLADQSGLGTVWQAVLNSVLAWPGFLVVGIPGLFLAIAGRSRATQISNIGQV